MQPKTILFDLDGTLLPMDQDAFIETYFRELSLKFAAYGFEPKAFVKAMHTGVGAMMQNDGSRYNEIVFWDVFSKACGEEILKHLSVFEEFYHCEFERGKRHTGYNSKSAELVKSLRRKGHRVVLATSPVYPEIAVKARASWAGLSLTDFDLVTTYENSKFCKPNPAYYIEIAEKLGVLPHDCIMVGNDTRDDLPAAKVGMQVFILTDYLINKGNVDFSAYPHGSFEELQAFLAEFFL